METLVLTFALVFVVVVLGREDAGRRILDGLIGG